MLTCVQDGKTEALPGCPACWHEAIDRKIKITKAVPIKETKA